VFGEGSGFADHQIGLKPITKEALYPEDSLEKIKDVKMGRPLKKPATPDTPSK
jgi:hypothetical protein